MYRGRLRCAHGYATNRRTWRHETSTFTLGQSRRGHNTFTASRLDGGSIRRTGRYRIHVSCLSGYGSATANATVYACIALLSAAVADSEFRVQNPTSFDRNSDFI